jgi:glycosyltransferase involved in cell wall biosynthesis
MRLAYFTGSYPRATDTFIQREVAGLRQRGLDVITFTLRVTGKEHDVNAEVVAEKNRTHSLLPAGPFTLLVANAWFMALHPIRYIKALWLAFVTRRPGLRGFIYQIFYFQEAVLLARKIYLQKIEHLHNHLGDVTGTVTMLAARLSGVGYSITIHGPHIFFDPTHWALREKLKYSLFIACISHYCKSQMMLFTDVADWGKLQIIRCGIDLSIFQYTPPRSAGRRLLYVGRLAPEKGIPVLIESLAGLKEQGYEFELVLAGDGPERASLTEMVEAAGLGDRVIFAGYIEQSAVVRHMKESDVLVLPSFAEGVPVTLMEAMALGIPVISTYVGGIAELVEPGVGGQLVFPSDVEALSKAIARILDDHRFRTDTALRARERVASEFDLDVQLDKLAQLFLKARDWK